MRATPRRDGRLARSAFRPPWPRGLWPDVASRFRVNRASGIRPGGDATGGRVAWWRPAPLRRRPASYGWPPGVTSAGAPGGAAPPACPATLSPAPDGAPVATPAGGPAPAGTPLPAAVGAPALDGLGCVAFPGAATAGFAGDVAGSLAVAAAEGFPAPAGSPAAGVAAREGLPARRPVTALAAAGVAPRAVGRAGPRRVQAGVLGRGRPQRRDRRDGAPGDRGADRDDQRGLRGQREPGRSLGAGDDARCDAACAAGAPTPVMPWSMPATTAPRSVRISASCASSGARSPWISGSPLRALVVRDVRCPSCSGTLRRQRERGNGG